MGFSLRSKARSGTVSRTGWGSVEGKAAYQACNVTVGPVILGEREVGHAVTEATVCHQPGEALGIGAWDVSGWLGPYAPSPAD